MARLNMASILLKVRPPRLAIGLGGLAVAVHLLTDFGLHRPLIVPAMTVAGAGFFLMLRAWWLFKQAGTAICPDSDSSRLVVNDVYSQSRNPMYLGITAMLGGLALIAGSVPAYVAAGAFFVCMDRVFCPYEEQKAAREFGATYERYRQRVRRWI